MIHPSETAVDYIWNYFAAVLFSEETQGLLPSIKKVIQAAEHRPFQVESKEHQDFLRKQLALIEGLRAQYDFLSFERERRLLEEQII